MKTIMKKLILAVVLVLFTFSAAACSAGAPQADQSDSPAGVYNLIKAVSGDKEYSAADAGMAGVLTLNEDGTGTLEVMGGELEVTWDSEKKTITSSTIEDSYEYHDGVFEWTMDDVVQVFEKVEEEASE
ncbi:MAG: hypothetical protein IJ252_02305 [Solobacterium sp.]|nr:hypothetical protein [Solobacterium sp.]